MLPDRVSNPGPLTYESGALPIALRGPARKVWCNIALMHPKDADGMANSIDHDQTASSEAVWSWSALFAETYLSQYIEFVRYLSITLL